MNDHAFLIAEIRRGTIVNVRHHNIKKPKEGGMMNELPENLIHEIQKYTNTPWWNARAYVEYAGYYALAIHAAKARDELDAIVAELRAAKDYSMSDRIRTIAQNIDDAISDPEPKLARRCAGS